MADPTPVVKDPVGACTALLKALRDCASIMREQSNRDAATHLYDSPARDALVNRTSSCAEAVERWLDTGAPVFADLMKPDRETLAHNAALDTAMAAIADMIAQPNFGSTKALDADGALRLTYSNIEKLKRPT